MNGEPLPVRHGFPARLVIPGLYGYVSATKWLERDRADDVGGLRRLLDPAGLVEGRADQDAVADRCAPLGRRPTSGPQDPIAGVAWAPTREIERSRCGSTTVPWHEATLSGALSNAAWVQWLFEWDATPGEHRISVRATDGTGETQTEERTAPAPNGASGYHSIRVDVR